MRITSWELATESAKGRLMNHIEHRKRKLETTHVIYDEKKNGELMMAMNYYRCARKAKPCPYAMADGEGCSVSQYVNGDCEHMKAKNWEGKYEPVPVGCYIDVVVLPGLSK